MKQLVILIAQVKYPSSNASYLTANSYVTESSEELEKAWDDLRDRIEVDDFKVINNLVYVVPADQIKGV